MEGADTGGGELEETLLMSREGLGGVPSSRLAPLSAGGTGGVEGAEGEDSLSAGGGTGAIGSAGFCKI